MKKITLLLSVVFSLLGTIPCVHSINEVSDDPHRLLIKFLQGLPLPAPQFAIEQAGLLEPLDYSLYGDFLGVDTAAYHFEIKEANRLKKDIGAGIYPNDFAVTQEPNFMEWKKQGLLDGLHWSWLKEKDVQKAFYVWATAGEEKGVKTFFTGVTLEKAGLMIPAIKAYYAALIHFPRSICWAEDKSFVWYIAPAALESIKRILRDYPQLGWELVGASASVENGTDLDFANDIIKVNPGKFEKVSLEQRLNKLPDLSGMNIMNTRGKGTVQVVQFENGHWQLRVAGRPYFIKGITYSPTEIGFGPHNDERFLDRWMFQDKNGNGRVDAAYDAWVDANANGFQDADEPAVGDFKLLKGMGINTIRLYLPNVNRVTYDPQLVNKELLRDLNDRFGIKIIAGDFLGAYTQGSGASWEKGTDYTDPEQLQKMKDLVRAKVLDLKDEPFVLMWLLGNENNMPGDYLGVNATRTNAATQPVAYAKFLNEVAAMIHELDPNHPVAVGNIEVNLFELYREHAPEIDILGINSYRGKEGFGALWSDAQKLFDRPVVITEFGSDAYYQDEGVDEDSQREYHQGNFRDIVIQQAGGPAVGNSIGGIIFEYLDEWWKDTRDDPENVQQTQATFKFPFADGYSHEEWLGIVSQGSGKNSPFERRLRKAYFYYQETHESLSASQD